MQEGMTCGHCGEGAMCKCPHHKMIPLFITLIGVTFLLKAYGSVSAEFAAYSWSTLLTLIGLMKLTKGMCKCCGPKM